MRDRKVERQRTEVEGTFKREKEKDRKSRGVKDRG